MNFRPAAAVVLAVGVSVLLAACGGAHKPAHRGPTGASAAEDVKFSKCMREHGLSNFPDVSANGGLPIQHELDGSIDILIDGVPQPVSQPVFQAAMHACARYSTFSTSIGGQTLTNIQSALVRTADCMRKHGVRSYPDPPALGSRAPLHLSPTGQARSAGINVDSPAFKAALAKCGSIMSNAMNGR